MNSTPRPPGSEPQDGFDLIDYPCDFAFKAMCRSDAQESSIEHIRGLVLPLIEEAALLGLKSNASRTGKFESITVTIRLQGRDELESIYSAIAQSSRVVMTL